VQSFALQKMLASPLFLGFFRQRAFSIDIDKDIVRRVPTTTESWKSAEIITMKIAFTSRSAAALRENDLANRRPPMPSLATTRGGTTAAVYSRCQSQRDL